MFCNVIFKSLSCCGFFDIRLHISDSQVFKFCIFYYILFVGCVIITKFDSVIVI